MRDRTARIRKAEFGRTLEVPDRAVFVDIRE
jgi:hypothetical protein